MWMKERISLIRLLSLILLLLAKISPFFFVFLGNSLPSRNPKVATISPGFPLESVKNRFEGTTDDFTGTGSNNNYYSKPSSLHSNIQSWATLNWTANIKGLFIVCEL